MAGLAGDVFFNVHLEVNIQLSLGFATNGSTSPL